MGRYTSYRYTLLGLGLIILVGMVLVGSQQPARFKDPLMYWPGVMVEGASQEEWSARHWQWSLSLPVGVNPGQDVTGSACAYGQSGPVYFLPRNFAPCTVPVGASILIPVAGIECAATEPAPYAGASEEELRNCATREVDRYTNIEVRIDGEVVPNIKAYRTSSPLFALWLPENNVLGAPVGATYAVADGYQIIMRPLEPGEYEIVVHLETIDGVVLPDKRTHITVAEPTWTQPFATPVSGTPVAISDENRQ